jgi:hypothetical protein
MAAYRATELRTGIPLTRWPEVAHHSLPIFPLAHELKEGDRLPKPGLCVLGT